MSHISSPTHVHILILQSHVKRNIFAKFFKMVDVNFIALNKLDFTVKAKNYIVLDLRIEYSFKEIWKTKLNKDGTEGCLKRSNHTKEDMKELVDPQAIYVYYIFSGSKNDKTLSNLPAIKQARINDWLPIFTICLFYLIV